YTQPCSCSSMPLYSAWPAALLSLLPVLFLWARRPLSSPPCPYTTLFRSDRTGGGVTTDRGGRRLPGSGIGTADRSGRAGIRLRGDRKSTRLNSSHVSTSYAVFCLKKKTTLLLGWLRAVSRHARVVAQIAD